MTYMAHGGKTIVHSLVGWTNKAPFKELIFVSKYIIMQPEL